MFAPRGGYVVVLGSVNMDLVAQVPRLPEAGETLAGSGFRTHPGGKGANQAVAAARLGAPIHMIARVGDDAFGQSLLRGLNEAGVATAAVSTSAASSGVAVILVSETGENSIVVVPGANALLSSADIDANLQLIRGAALVLTQLEVPIATVEHLATVCTREGIPLLLDPAPAQPLSAELLRQITWLTPNESEAAFYAGSGHDSPAATASALLKMGVGGVALKLGARGVYVQAAGGDGIHVRSHAVKAVDTTGAGDCFNGAFATALLEGLEPEPAARFAAAAAALSVTKRGAQEAMPGRVEVEWMLDLK